MHSPSQTVVDLAHDRDHMPRFPMPEYLVDWVSHKYGLKSLVDQVRVALFSKQKFTDGGCRCAGIFTMLSLRTAQRILLSTPSVDFWKRSTHWSISTSTCTTCLVRICANGAHSFCRECRTQVLDVSHVRVGQKETVNHPDLILAEQALGALLVVSNVGANTCVRSDIARKMIPNKVELHTQIDNACFKSETKVLTGRRVRILLLALQLVC